MSEGLIAEVADAIERVTVERQGQGFRLITGRNDSEAFARAVLSVLEPRIEALERELAEAVAAERERCARIAERLAEREVEDFNEQAWAEAIATAIRSGDEG